MNFACFFGRRAPSAQRVVQLHVEFKTHVPAKLGLKYLQYMQTDSCNGNEIKLSNIYGFQIYRLIEQSVIARIY